MTASNNQQQNSAGRSFRLFVKLARWAPDDPNILAVQFYVTVPDRSQTLSLIPTSESYQNSELFKLLSSRTYTLGDSHEYSSFSFVSGPDGSGTISSSITVKPGTFQSVVTGQFAFRYGNALGNDQRKALYEFFLQSYEKYYYQQNKTSIPVTGPVTMTNFPITLKINNMRLIQYTSPSFADWLPPRKIYVEILWNASTAYMAGAQKMRELFIDKLGFQNINATYEWKGYATGSLADLFLNGIPKNLRRCDTVVVYVTGAGYTMTVNDASGEADGTDEYISIGVMKDDSFRDAIKARMGSLNGASVTVIIDSNVTDLVDAPVNVVMKPALSHAGSFVPVIQNMRGDIIRTTVWPNEVKVIYGVNRNIQNNSPLDKCGRLASGSSYYGASFLVQGILETFTGSNTSEPQLTYKQLLLGIRDFYKNRLSKDFNDDNNKDNAVIDDDQRKVAEGLGIINDDSTNNNIEPMLGCANASMLDTPVFNCFDPNLRGNINKQQGPIKKAVLVGVDCWTGGGRFVQVTDGNMIAPQINSPRNDTLLMYKMLVEKMGFLPQNVAVVRNQPGRKEVLQALDWLLSSDNIPGNTLLFYFSGHGAQTVDGNGDEVDGQDEFMVLQNGTQMEKFLDDDVYKEIIQRKMEKNPGCSLWCIFDSCHSGTMGDPMYVTTAEFEPSPIINKTPSGLVQVPDKSTKYYTNMSKRPVASISNNNNNNDDNDGLKNIFLLSATSDTTVTYEFTPKSLKLPLPDFPRTRNGGSSLWGDQWEYWPNPPFSCMCYFLWRVMEERAWVPISLNDLLIRLKEKYNSLPEYMCKQCKSVPTLGTFWSPGTELKSFPV